MNFLDYSGILIQHFQSFEIAELLELNYSPYSFGSGFIAYRFKGHNLKIVYDGRERSIDVKISQRHTKYGYCEYKTLWTGDYEKMNGIDEIVNILRSITV